MSDEVPQQRPDPNRSSRTYMLDAVLVRFTAKLLPHDSPEFQERARRPRPNRNPAPQPPEEPKPDQNPPPAE